MPTYMPQYRSISTELDLAEDAGADRGGERTRARERLIGAMRMDSLLHGAVCVPDTALFTGPQIVSLWTDGVDCTSTMSDFFGQRHLPTGRLHVMGRAPSLRESLLRFVFRRPGEVSSILLHLSPERNRTISESRERAARLQDELASLDAKVAQRMYDDAERLASADVPGERFVRRLVEPYRAALGADVSDPDIVGFICGWSALLRAEEQGRLIYSAPRTDVPDSTNVAFRRVLEKLRADLYADELWEGSLAPVLVRQIDAALGGERADDLRESDVQAVVRRGVEASELAATFAGVDRDAAATSRAALPLIRTTARMMDADVRRMAERLDEVFKECELIRARHFCAQHDIDRVALERLQFGEPSRVQRAVPASDPFVLLGRASEDQLGDLLNVWRVKLAQSDLSRLRLDRSTGLRWAMTDASKSEAYAEYVAGCLDEAIFDTMKPPRRRVLPAALSAAAAAAVTGTASHLEPALVAGGVAGLVTQFLSDSAAELVSGGSQASVSARSGDGTRLTMVSTKSRPSRVREHPAVVAVARRATRGARHLALTDVVSSFEPPE